MVRSTMNLRASAVLLFGLVTMANPAYAASRTARVALEAGGGIVGTAAGMIGVGALAFAVTPDSSGSCSGFCLGPDVGAAILGGIAGGVAGLGTGVYTAGTVSDGHGAYWSAMAGEGVGLAAAASFLGIGLVCESYNHSSCAHIMMPIAVIGFLTLPLAGSIVGYEWSSNANRPTAKAALTSQPLIGWSGSF